MELILHGCEVVNEVNNILGALCPVAMPADSPCSIILCSSFRR